MENTEKEIKEKQPVNWNLVITIALIGTILILVFVWDKTSPAYDRDRAINTLGITKSMGFRLFFSPSVLVVVDPTTNARKEIFLRTLKKVEISKDKKSIRLEFRSYSGFTEYLDVSLDKGILTSMPE